MEIIRNNIDEIIDKLGYTYKKEDSNTQLNIFLTYWHFFDEKEKDIQEFLRISLETILYSKYYWCTLYKKRYHELYGEDTGIDQQQYKIIEDMTQRLNDVDWNLIQMIEELECSKI